MLARVPADAAPANTRTDVLNSVRAVLQGVVSNVASPAAVQSPAWAPSLASQPSAPVAGATLVTEGVCCLFFPAHLNSHSLVNSIPLNRMSTFTHVPVRFAPRASVESTIQAAGLPAQRLRQIFIEARFAHPWEQGRGTQFSKE